MTCTASSTAYDSRTALRAALDAHPSLGGRIVADHGALRMHAGALAVEVAFMTVPEADIAEVLAVESVTGVSREGPLTRCLVLEVAPSHHTLLIVWHHLAMDGASLRILLRDLTSAWAGRPVERESTAGPGEQNTVVVSDSRTRSRALAIAERLSDLDPQPLPRRHGVPDVPLRVTINQPAPDLAATARACRVTVPMLINAAYQCAIGDVLGLDEFILGCVTAGRGATSEAAVIGTFANTVLQRGNSSPAGILRRSSCEFLGAIKGQEVPAGAVFKQLLAGVQPRPTSFPQLYLSLEAAFTLAMDGLRSCRHRIWHAQGKFDVMLSLEYTADGVTGMLHHRNIIMEPDTAERLAATFVSRLQSIRQTADGGA